MTSIRVNGQQTATLIRIKSKQWPSPPSATNLKGLALPWWQGQGTCLLLLCSVLWGQLCTQLEVKCDPGISLGSPLASLWPLTSTRWNKLRWKGGVDQIKHIFLNKSTSPHDSCSVKLVFLLCTSAVLYGQCTQARCSMSPSCGPKWYIYVDLTNHISTEYGASWWTLIQSNSDYSCAVSLLYFIAQVFRPSFF